MLPPVESDERLAARGLYQQIRRAEPTRFQEVWSIHRLPDEATIWRTQLLYDQAIPMSACYLLRDPDFRPVQMVFYWRWQDGREDLIEYRFMPGYATILYRDQAQDMILPADYDVFGWHTIMSHLLWRRYDYRKQGRQALTLIGPGLTGGTLWPALLEMEAVLDRREIIPGPAGPHKGSAFTLRMVELGPQTLVLDSFGVPLRWVLPAAQLTFELTEYERMESRA